MKAKKKKQPPRTKLIIQAYTRVVEAVVDLTAEELNRVLKAVVITCS